MKKILILTAFFLLIPLWSFSKVYLVSVGISDYPGNDMDLNLSDKDAQTITWLYSKNKSLHYCQLLNEKATQENIIKAMESVYSKASENDIVVLFYSGHGYEGGFYVYDGCMGYDKIRQAMAKSECKNKMIFADACFSGKIRTNGNTSSQSQVADAKKANVMLFLSSRNNEYSYERSDMENGFFTTYLQKGLRGSADKNKNRIITAKELFEYVHSRVSEISNGQQHPVMWGKFSDNMTIMQW